MSGHQRVEGLAAAGAAPSGNPVLIAGEDGTNVVRVRTDADGRPIVTTSQAVVADSQGVLTNPAANTLLADTGVLSAGRWVFDIVAWMETGGAAATTITVEHRNGANGANIRSQRLNLKAADQVAMRYNASFALDERLRVIIDAAPGVGFDVQATVSGHRLGV